VSADARVRRPPGAARRKALTTLAAVVRLVTGLFALILVVYVVFVVAQANPGNWLTVFVTEWATSLNFGLDTLFEPADPTLRVVVNYGAAAVIWLIIGAVIGRILRRFA
jgi:hypothetical protein